MFWGILSIFGGLRFGVPVTTLKINKMAIFGWISFKFGICGPITTKICMTNIFPKKRDFRIKNAQQIGENIFCQQRILFLDIINWFMHKNQG